MKLSIFHKTAQKGFTLIELLVVIGILGILVAGVLAALNPIEQINRAQDSNTENAATQIYSALSRYYAVKQAYPWDVAGSGCATGPVAAGVKLATGTPLTEHCVITALTNAAELKTAPGTDVLQRIHFAGTNNASPGVDSYTLCWDPSSSSESQGLTYNNVGAAGTDHQCIK